MKFTRRKITECLLALADERGLQKTFCLSEAARHLDPDLWRNRLPDVWAEAIRLVVSGKLRCTQRGHQVDPENARGPLRFSAPRP